MREAISFKAIVAIWLVQATFALAAVGIVGYVVWHFIHKFW